MLSKCVKDQMLLKRERKIFNILKREGRLHSLLASQTRIFFSILGYILSAVIHTICLGSLLFFLYYYSNFSALNSHVSKIWVSLCVDPSKVENIPRPQENTSFLKKRSKKRSFEHRVHRAKKNEDSKKEEIFLEKKSEFFGEDQVLVPPKFQGNVTLFYPEEAQEEGMEGEVVLTLRLSQEGKVVSTVVKKSSGWKILDVAAANYAKGLKFIPCYRNGIPIEALIEFPFAFKLKNDQSEI